VERGVTQDKRLSLFPKLGVVYPTAVAEPLLFLVGNPNGGENVNMSSTKKGETPFR